MWIELPVPWLIAANILGWLGLHLAIAWAGTRLPPLRFDPWRPLYRPRAWEDGGRFYERFLAVRKWKDLLPDGAAWFQGGFPKAKLPARNPPALRRFTRETCRGEAVHWAVMAAAPFFFLWNPPGAGLVMLAYGVLANLPCIIIQRYNRNRLARLGGMPARVHHGQGSDSHTGQHA